MCLGKYDMVVETVYRLGIALKVVKLKPLWRTLVCG